MERSACSSWSMLFAGFTLTIVRFLDSALRATLEMTKSAWRNGKEQGSGRDGRFLDSALRASLEMTGGRRGEWNRLAWGVG